MARKKKIDSNKPTKVVKKRKVGRPKKRGRKKNYYTPKKKTKKVASKGFSRNLTYNRVRSVLWSNFKDDSQVIVLLFPIKQMKKEIKLKVQALYRRYLHNVKI